MTALMVVGGVYHEACMWPHWDQIFGSGGRAAAAISGLINDVTLISYATQAMAAAFEATRNLYGFSFAPQSGEQAISFEYVHSLTVPVIRPSPSLIVRQQPLRVTDDIVLRFGMMEGTAVVEAERCIYDPQSAYDPDAFGANGSKANHLAIVANRAEIERMSGGSDAIGAARSMVDGKAAEVVVVKSGAAGAIVVTANGVTSIPAYRSERVWKIGSGDVFAAAFAVKWGIQDQPAVEAARFASNAVALYASSMALPISPAAAANELPEARVNPGTVYLAGPFFNMSQRWLVEEARRGLTELGMSVFSPLHDVGEGSASEVAPADIAAVRNSDVIFALADGLDSGTLFEIGYARACNKPVYVFAQTVSSEDLKMIEGSDCKVFNDFVTALHHAAWRT